MDQILSQAHWKNNVQIAKLARSLIFWKRFPEFLFLEPTHWTKSKKNTRKNQQPTVGRNQKFANVESN